MADRHGNDCWSNGWAPFRVVVLAEIEPRPDFALRCPAPRRTAALTANTFDRLLSAVEPAFRLQLPDRWSGKEPEVDIRWQQWSDVAGGGLLASPAIAAMRDAHTSLSRGTGRTDPYVYVDRVLPGNRTRLPEAGQVALATDRLGKLFDSVDLPVMVEDERPGARFASAAADLQAALSAVLCDALAHPEYRRLRRVWQSLRSLSLRLGDPRLVELVVISCSSSIEDLEEALTNVEADLVIHEAPFEACARDAASMNLLADWGARLKTQILTSLDASWVAAPARTSSNPDLRIADLARPWLDGVCRREQARWLTIALNDRCDGEPVAGSIVRGGPICSQPREAESSWTFLPAGVALGEVVIQLLVREGEPFVADTLTPVFRSPALYEIATSNGSVAVGTRWFCTENAAVALAQLGVCAFVPTLNRDNVRLLDIPAAYRPRNAAGELDPPASTFGEQILAGRVAKFLQGVLPLCQAQPGERSGCVAPIEKIEQALGSLFPKAPPVGPFIEVVESQGNLTISIRPRRYGQLRVEQLAWTLHLG